MLQLLGVPATNATELEDIKADVAAAKAAAEAADAKAANARQMVLNRDGTLASLSQTAAQFGSVTAAADATHQTLQNEITALQQALANVQLTPGPKGDKGDAGTAGSNGAAGLKGDQGVQGIAGTANLAVGLGPVGALLLNGNTTVTIPLSRTMPNNTYTVAFAHSAVVNLATVSFTNVVKTTTAVTVRVNSVGLALVAGTLLVVAW